MQKNKLNNVIVLKEISSNIVEEAIVVLKPNVNLKQEEKKALTLSKKENMSSKSVNILKEAEFVIQNCVEQIETRKKEIINNQIEKKCKILKKITSCLIIINILLIIKLF